jgi:hypothetical protein
MCTLCKERVREATARVAEILGSNFPEVLSMRIIQNDQIG